MIQEAIKKCISNQNLSEQEAVSVMNQIMGGEATDAQLACFITALRMKGETIDEITGCARVMRIKATRISPNLPDSSINLVDTCGTGGDGANTFNISTAAAFITAAAGVPVAKHGNKAVSSRCGSADVLAALGVNLQVTPEKVCECIEKIGIGFLFAPLLHGAMKYAIGPRKEIAVRTVFNILGPLTNPAGAAAQIIGVYDPALTGVMAEVLNKLGTKQAFVVYGKDGLDEISISGETRVSELRDGKIKQYTVKPEDFGIRSASRAEIQGGTAEENAEIIRKLFSGEKGPRRDIACLNAAAAIVAGNGAVDIKEGLEKAYETVDSGRAAEKVRLLAEMTDK